MKTNTSVIEACKYAGISIPRFCYYESLSIAGNCRMCLVEIEKTPKPVAACTTIISKDIQIYTDTPVVKKARENILELLLINHPLDCPICDQAGECDLQDQTKVFGIGESRFFFNKRGVENKNCGPLIKTVMTRCIHCTRCVRFDLEHTGIEYFGTLGRGTHTEIGGYVSKTFSSEISGNIVDLCPVGALTSKPYAFKARPWELRSHETIDLTDSVGSSIYINFKESQIVRVIPKNNIYLNENFISDKARYSFDALKKNRIQKIFVSKILITSQFLKDLYHIGRLNSSELVSISFSKFIDSIGIFTGRISKNSYNFPADTYVGKKLLILIDSEINLELLTFFRNLSFFSKIVRLKKVDGTVRKDNFIYYKNQTLKTIVDSNTNNCFFFSSNIRLECSILNTKIRSKVLKQKLNIVSLGLNFDSTFPVRFINLNLNSILTIIESKNFFLSNFLISSKNPLLFIGEQLKTRIKNLDFLNYKIIPSAVIVDILLKSNTNGINLHHIGSISRNDLQSNKEGHVLAINLDDNISIRKIIKFIKMNLNSIIVWFNSHGSKIAGEAQIVIPIASCFENEGTYINLEGRPQKTLKTFNKELSHISILNFFKRIDNKNLGKNLKKDSLFQKSKKFDFFNEMTQSPIKFNRLKGNFNLKGNFFTKLPDLLTYYPLKSSLEDSNISNKFTKNSSIMAECSQAFRKSYNNFI